MVYELALSHFLCSYTVVTSHLYFWIALSNPALGVQYRVGCVQGGICTLHASRPFFMPGD